MQTFRWNAKLLQLATAVFLAFSPMSEGLAAPPKAKPPSELSQRAALKHWKAISESFKPDNFSLLSSQQKRRLIVLFADFIGQNKFVDGWATGLDFDKKYSLVVSFLHKQGYKIADVDKKSGDETTVDAAILVTSNMLSHVDAWFSDPLVRLGYHSQLIAQLYGKYQSIDSSARQTAFFSYLNGNSLASGDPITKLSVEQIMAGFNAAMAAKKADLGKQLEPPKENVEYIYQVAGFFEHFPRSPLRYGGYRFPQYFASSDDAFRMTGSADHSYVSGFTRGESWYASMATPVRIAKFGKRSAVFADVDYSFSSLDLSAVSGSDRLTIMEFSHSVKGGLGINIVNVFTLLVRVGASNSDGQLDLHSESQLVGNKNSWIFAGDVSMEFLPAPFFGASASASADLSRGVFTRIVFAIPLFVDVEIDPILSFQQPLTISRYVSPLELGGDMHWYRPMHIRGDLRGVSNPDSFDVTAFASVPIPLNSTHFDAGVHFEYLYTSDHEGYGNGSNYLIGGVLDLEWFQVSGGYWFGSGPLHGAGMVNLFLSCTSDNSRGYASLYQLLSPANGNYGSKADFGVSYKDETYYRPRID